MKKSISKLFIIVAISFFIISKGIKLHAQLSSWQYRVPVTIYENSSANLTDYQVLLYFDTQTPMAQGKMKTDGSDIRFAEDCSGIFLLNYWIESGLITTYTKIWVKVPSIVASSTDTIYLFYGSTSATSTSNGANTFIFFDDFTTNTIGTKWSSSTQGTANVDLSAKNLKIGADPGESGIVTASAFAAPFAVMFDVTFDNIPDTTVGAHGGALLRNNQIAGRVNPDEDWRIDWIDRSSDRGYRIFKLLNGSYTSLLSVPSRSYTWSLGKWQKWEIRTLNNSGKFAVNELFRSNSNDYTDSLFEIVSHTDAAVGSIFYFSLWSYVNREARYDNIAIRKFTFPELTTSIGVEQAFSPLIANFDVITECLGDTTQFTDLSTGNPVSWSWDFGDGITSTQQNSLHLYNTIGEYEVQLIVSDTNGCQVSYSRKISVYPIPQSISVIIGSETVTENEIKIYAVSYTANSKYTWIINGGAQVSGSNSNSIYVLWGAAGSGKVCVIETNSFGCGGDTVCLDVTVASPTVIDELARSNNSIEVYPNPAYEYLNIELNSDMPQLVSIKFYDVRGSLIKEMAPEALS